MEHQITIREAVTETDVAAFWRQLHIYQQRDIFSGPEDEDLAYFLDDTQYRAQIQEIHDRTHDRLYYLFFYRGEQSIGFAMPAIYTTEDGKCFILEFCVYPQFRGAGTGTACAKTLFQWAKKNGAKYAELNYGSDARRQRFWRRLGFVENGNDEWGESLMLLPSKVFCKENQITLDTVTEENWLDIANLSVKEEQKSYVAPPIGILARAYVYRDHNSHVYVIKQGETIIGIAMVREFHDEPVGYDLQQFMIDQQFQNQGYGSEALRKILEKLKAQETYSTVEVCVKKADAEALHLYEKVGFVDSGYVDEDIPDCYNLIYRF